MNLFKQVISQYPPYKELEKAIQKAEFPCLVTGISGVHKAQFVLGLADTQVLVVAEDDAAAARISNDINEMAGGLRNNFV